MIGSLYLAVAIWGALFTATALAAPFRRWLFQGPGFFASWLTAELAGQHLAWQIAATLAFSWAGAFAGPLGLAGLAVSALSWIGLVRLLYEGRRTRIDVEEALIRGLGANHAESIPEDRRKALSEGRGVLTWILPFWRGDRRVDVTRDIVYAEHGGARLKLDVYARKDRPQNAPALLFLHGGGWVIGRKEDHGQTLLTRLAAHGWVCVTANYRLAPRATFPEPMVDVKAAIKWVREQGHTFGATSGFLAISGGSAGGHLAALAAVTPNEPSLQPGFEDADTHVDACVPFYAVYDFTDPHGVWRTSLLFPLLEKWLIKRSRSEAPEVFRAASPVQHVGAGSPPFFVLHGTRDTLVPVAEARAFVEALRARSRSAVVYAELRGGEHAFEVFHSVRSHHAVRAAEVFLEWVFARWQRGSAARAEQSPAARKTPN